MIQVYKDLENVPNSLKRVEEEKRTNPYNKKDAKLFKQKDTKEALHKIYKGKCAFCEQKLSIGGDRTDTRTIEHYRPKSRYYWLAFSWDNLLLCCRGCNKNKADNFEILGQEALYDDSFIENIHSSTVEYQNREQPKMVHPELESVVEQLSFSKKGKIDSNDSRVQYTIDTCYLNRPDLIEKRKTVIDEFFKKIKDRKLAKKPINDILKSLVDDIKQKEEDFLAFRYWIFKNYKSLIEVD